MGTRSIRKVRRLVRPKRLPHARSESTSVSRNRLAGELLGVCAGACTRFHADPGAGALAALKGFPATADYARQLIEDADTLSRVHTRWRGSTGYFDEDGHPRVIPVSGPAPSYEALCRECGVVSGQVEHLLEMACALKMCTRMARGRLRYLSEIPLFTGNPSLMLARAVVNVERFLRTGEYNAKPGRAVSESLADRTTQVPLSEREFRLFVAEMRAILHDFIESTDRRLLAATAKHPPRGTSRRRRLSGVTAFVFRD